MLGAVSQDSLVFEEPVPPEENKKRKKDMYLIIKLPLQNGDMLQLSGMSCGIASAKANKMDTEMVESIDVTDDARSFSWAVDSAIRSETGSIFGESRVRSFASLVDSAIRSSSASEADLGSSPSPVHAFASAVDIRTVAARLFTVSELNVATNNFSFDNKIDAGGLDVVEYRGELIDGHEVAIKRVKTWLNLFGKSEFALFSRLHHKNLVGLVGFCEAKDERLLVYEYMKNGALYHHLHGKNGSSVLNSWKMRIKIAVDVSQGIQYLHNYASIIHRNINSSNILFDATWTARVSGFDLSLMNPEPDWDYRTMGTVGTYGYIDPEYYGLNVLTAKSDVYGLGVVLLELLTGKKAIFKYGANDFVSTTIKSVVDFAVPTILAGELVKILDPRVGPPDVNEAEALELVAYTAIHCVNLEGKDRPTMADIVANLERALAICESSHI
ncbi:putative serine/threonine-protein kinase-like protein CCR3 [Glycine soja]|uniref:Putative serine/threonine-protein kinase-like protein CCR3 n=2 Tax=Glycine soja TaxID=3848 RepID=A0A445HHA5_GLYSO|nr:putative serine/threonine-protein kinase-like protein CCR3 [Glycine soja]